MKRIFGTGRWANFKHAFSSKEAFINYAEAPKPEGDESNRVRLPDNLEPDPMLTPQWTNIDLAQSPPQDRIWGKYVYLAFWIAHAAGELKLLCTSIC